MTTLFIADLHLSDDEPAITAGFLAFLKREAVNADALYILGDLFEVWIGDDDPSPLHQTVAKALAELYQHGIPCFFIHGNRDFLIGKRFASASKMVLLPTEQVINVYQQRALILHGDTLCTDDTDYQRFRRKMHNRLLQWIYLRFPLTLRQRIANTLRNESMSANNDKSLEIMDVNKNTVIEAFKSHQVSLMIHGHTHRPAIHLTKFGQQTFTRVVMGAWHDRGSVLRIAPSGQLDLANFSF